jgi:hypothetical protein
MIKGYEFYWPTLSTQIQVYDSCIAVDLICHVDIIMQPSELVVMIRKINTPIHQITRGPDQHFFGYYDKCPWNGDETLMLTIAIPSKSAIRQGQPADIGTIDLKNDNKIDILAKTFTWNWQQGAMLEWLPGSNDRKIIYNNRQKNRFVSVILDITSGKKRTLPLPVGAISHNGKHALSINYARLYDTRRDYGYFGLKDPWRNEQQPSADGIHLMDIATGKFNLILSLKQIAEHDTVTSSQNVKHWVNHVSFNPCDTRFCFLHRFEIPKVARFGTRLFTANLDGTDLRCLWSNHVSHFYWLDENSILAWAVKQPMATGLNSAKLTALSILKRHDGLYKRLKMFPAMRSRVYGGAFFMFRDITSDEPSYRTVGEKILTEDGHCSYSPDKSWILMDTYPDINANRHVILYNESRKECFDIARLYSPPELTGPLRCDLHARWNHDGTQVCVDSAHEGIRQMYLLNVSQITRK